MPRRPRSTPPLPTCPICGAADVEVVGHEGIDNQLTVLRCTVCERTWSELVSDQSTGDDDAPV